MSKLRGFNQKLTSISRLLEQNAYDKALGEVEALLEQWPGNSHLHVLLSRLVQLQNETDRELREAKEALELACELEKDSPVAPIELGHYLDNVEDDPKAASKSFACGVSRARSLLIEGLLGQAKALIQMGQRKHALQCLTEAIQLDRTLVSGKSEKAPLGELIDSEEIRELLSEAVAQRIR